MESPVLLWLDVGVTGESEPLPPLLAHSCRIRRADGGDLPAPSELQERAQVLCFNYDYPDLPGLQLLVRTKRRYPSVPVLMLTLHHSEELAVWAFRAQVFDYLVKPLRREEVEGCLHRLRAALAARRRQHARALQDVQPLPPRDSRYEALTPAQCQLQPALTYIARHFGETVREAAVADVCGMSAYRFGRAFKNAFGKTFQDYLIDHRIRAAKSLLANPHIAVIDVGLSVGFHDPSYFARIFRRRVGVSPTVYRRSLMADAPAAEQLPLLMPGPEAEASELPELPVQ